MRVDSSVDTVGNVGLDLGVRWARCLYLVQSIQAGCGALTAIYSIDKISSSRREIGRNLNLSTLPCLEP
jgi:hypothetical protein